MSLSVSIEIKTSPGLENLKPIDMDRIRRVAGRAFVNRVRSHLFQLDQKRPNVLGGQRTHFYAQAARSVQQPVVEGENVIVSINQVGIAQRYFGGTIKPKNGHFLTIPARAEAYGKRAREFNDLEFLWGRNGPVALIQRAQSTLPHRGKKTPRSEGGGIFYWLVREVTQSPDSSVVPSEQEIFDAVQPSITSDIKRQTGGSES